LSANNGSPWRTGFHPRVKPEGMLRRNMRSRLNQIEHCFGPITKKRIGRGVLKCVDERQAAISR
jgi:hypothetical protein